MLTTNQRTTQTLDPTAVSRLAVPACARLRVTATAYRASTLRSSATAPTSITVASAAAGNPWSIAGTEPMSKVDFHPDRWPLQSTS